MLALVAENNLGVLTEYLATEVRALASAGATMGLLAANTPHIVFDAVLERSPIPLLSIVHATCEAARVLHLRRVGIFGTRFTMEGRFYREVFSTAGIDLVTPRDDERAYIHEKYMDELVKGVFLSATRNRLLEIVGALRDRDAIDGVLLAGTELPLVLSDDTAAGIPLLDTTKIHVDSAVRELWGQRGDCP
jgi:aspartate racemase